MAEQRYELVELIKYIDPSLLDYNEWLAVGMGLKEEGYTAYDWDVWSQGDSRRYRSGECYKKWDGFNGSSSLITGGTIVQMAKDHGWAPPRHEEYALDWDSVIGEKDGLVVVHKAWIEDREIDEPKTWDPVAQLVRYLETLFEAAETVGYVTECYESERRYLPKKGAYDRTSGQLVQLLHECKGDVGAVFGDYNKKAGAWIRFNPLDGKGVKNENVTDFRYALVESDKMDIPQQNAIIRELELPVAALVHSGKKSLHAIVRIDAASYEEYRKRVDYLYDICKKNGLEVDRQNCNPSRLSRMPGIIRDGQKQFLVDTNIGKTSWNEWHDWIESVNDDLPEPESLEGVWNNLPELSPVLIDGILRQGHKMLLAGPSKAGKSYALIELCCAIAEGRPWLGFPCTKGRVLYVNLELDRPSCLHRFKDVYAALGWQPSNLNNIDIWNLRGKSIPMDKLAPKLIRRAAKKRYIAIVIDPIYKVITGDENSADQMARFCNQFDLVCHELGAAVIYCHHHSKGVQGQKRSMDRASGSGVFARDPDALLDLIELELTEEIMDQQKNRTACDAIEKWMYEESGTVDWEDTMGLDDRLVQKAFLNACYKILDTAKYIKLQARVKEAEKAAKNLTAWRIEGTLREFPKFPAINLWFNYPVHHVDSTGILGDVAADGGKTAKKTTKATTKRIENAELKNRSKAEEFEDAVNNCNMGQPPTVKDLIEWFSTGKKEISERTMRNWIVAYGYMIDKNKNNIVIKKEQ